MTEEVPASAAGQITVRRAAVGDEPMLRALRVQALTTDPDAFGSTLERELARTTADWQRWLSPGATFIAFSGDEPAGLVAGGHDQHDLATVNLMAMWVHPALRGSGAGDALVGALVSWAAAERARDVRLMVIAHNDRARRFYERSGFRVTGRETRRERDGAIEVEMNRILS
jgi:ribosomal protein S18 acetylase RimI-like enzyme